MPWVSAETALGCAHELTRQPRFIDTHTHAPQYPNLSFGQQYELLDWLTCV